jgi:hypothetical protein
MRAALIISALFVAACGGPAQHTEITAPPRYLDLVRPEVPAERPVLHEDVARGELPWWHDLRPGVYRFGHEVVVIAIGDSKDHHHIAEGFLHSKVMARLGTRRASEGIRFAAAPPEPALEDLFITRERRILAFYVLRVPKDAELPPRLAPLERPAILKTNGRHRVGRHVFESDRHLFLECDVEGPIANPDWGRTRAAARG